MVKTMPRALIALALVSAFELSPQFALAADPASGPAGSAQDASKKPAPTPRADNHGMLTLDIDFVDSAAGKRSDVALVAESLMRELGLKRNDANDPTRSQQVPVRWVALPDSKECADPDHDAGIIEVNHAALSNQDLNYFLGGSQLFRAELGFRVLNCKGDILYEYVGDGTEPFRSATIGSGYVSLVGLGGTVTLANVHANDKTAAAAATALGGISLKFPVYNPTTQQSRVLAVLMNDVRVHTPCRFAVPGAGKFDGITCEYKSRRQASVPSVAVR